MKNLFAMAAAVVVMTQAAQADFVRGRVRAGMRADLKLIDDGGITYPIGQSLSLNFEDGKSEPVSFTLREFTGIVCIMAPCPSDRFPEFKITSIGHSFHQTDVVRYEAVEVLKNIPAHVRIVPRKLFVTESSKEQDVTNWEVEVHTFPGRVQVYEGKPEGLIVTQ